MTRIYLDNNASTPMAPEVFEAMLPWLHENYGNASSVHWFGQRATAAVEGARRRVASLIGATPHEIIFTSGGTEADNLAILGMSEARKAIGRHLIVSSIEHPAVLSACRALESRGFDITYLGVDREGLIHPDELRAAIRPDTILISVMLANNETGVIQPVEEIVEVARALQVPVHTDAVQAVGKIPVDVKSLSADLLSLSAHKIHGPQGMGALYVRKGVGLTPRMLGGNQERKRRAGTESVAAAVGLGRAAELARQGVLSESPHIASLRDRFEHEILSRCPRSRVNGHRQLRVGNTTNLGFEDVDGEALLLALDMEGVAASMGAACSSGSLEPSHVLKAMGVRKEILRGSLRFSLSKFNTEEEIDRAAEIVCRTVEHIRSVPEKVAKQGTAPAVLE
ncbi:MAG: aminotransferase class V-fold PLP-dependent enzyme [Acidobacteriia bacterium]|nr:aminotransferase class V-fold PLP-dependent enzyme [Terriglobia bacterium]